MACTTLAPDSFQLPDSDAAGVGSCSGLHAFTHPSSSVDFPSNALGSSPAAPMPRRMQTPRAHLGGAKNDASGGKAWGKVPHHAGPPLMHGADRTPGLCTTSAPTPSQLAPMLVAAFPSWEAAQSLRHQVMSLHQGSGSKQCLLTELGCGCSPREPRCCISTTPLGAVACCKDPWSLEEHPMGSPISCAAGQHFAS